MLQRMWEVLILTNNQYFISIQSAIEIAPVLDLTQNFSNEDSPRSQFGNTSEEIELYIDRQD